MANPFTIHPLLSTKRSALCDIFFVLFVIQLNAVAGIYYLRWRR